MTTQPRVSPTATAPIETKRSVRSLILSVVGLSAVRSANPVPAGRASHRKASCKQLGDEDLD